MKVTRTKNRVSVLHERRKRKLIFRISLALGILVVLFVASIIMSWQKYFQIQTITVTGNQVVGEENIILSAKNSLANNYAWIWPKCFFLWYPNAQIKTDLLKQFPRLKNVTVSLKGKNSLILNIEERKPYVVWCADKSSLSDIPDSKNCYVLDRYGLVFDQAPKFSGHLFWHFFGELKTGQNIGANYLTPDVFHDLSGFLDEISSKGFDIIGFESFQVDGYYKIYLANNVYLLIATSQSFDATLRNLLALMKEKDMDLRDPQVSSRLDYIDLRFGNKINYKEKAGSMSTSTVKTN
jgi:hypothetical protein